MTINALLSHWRSDPNVGPNLVEWRKIPGKHAHYLPLPVGIEPDIKATLEQQGIHSLYTHQVATYEHISAGENVVVVTGTASGKTLSYNLPVLDHLLRYS